MQISKISLNFLNKYYQFYEWLSSDNIKEYKNVSLYRVSSKMIKDLLDFQIKMADKLKNNILIFSDEYTYIAVMFDENGKSKLKSSLLLSDEDKLDKKICSLKSSVFDYTLLRKDETVEDLRINNYMKIRIKNEIENIKKTNNVEKLEYIYYEWFSKKENDVEKMFNKIYKRLDNPISNIEKGIYEILALEK